MMNLVKAKTQNNTSRHMQTARAFFFAPQFTFKIIFVLLICGILDTNNLSMLNSTG